MNNDNDMTYGAHYVAAKKVNGKFECYNLYSSDINTTERTSIDSIVRSEGKFLSGIIVNK